MPGTDALAPGSRGRVDRRRDLAGWLVTPLFTLLAAPVTTTCVGMVLVMGADRQPQLCEPVRSENGCEEATLAMLAGHTVLFAALWLLLWAVPWWRGLRPVRILLALAAFAVLVAAPVRMAG